MLAVPSAQIFVVVLGKVAVVLGKVAALGTFCSLDGCYVFQSHTCALGDAWRLLSLQPLATIPKEDPWLLLLPEIFQWPPQHSYLYFCLDERQVPTAYMPASRPQQSSLGSVPAQIEQLPLR